MKTFIKKNMKYRIVESTDDSNKGTTIDDEVLKVDNTIELQNNFSFEIVSVEKLPDEITVANNNYIIKLIK